MCPMTSRDNIILQYIRGTYILIGYIVFDQSCTYVLVVNDSDRFVAKITDSQTRTPTKHMQNTIRVGKINNQN